MKRFTFGLAAVVIGVCGATVWVARRLGKSGSRPSIMISVVSGWVWAYVVWGFLGGLAASYGLLATYNPTLFGALAVVGGLVQYRIQVREGRERGLVVFVAGQIVWLLVVMAQNGIFG